MPDCQVELGLYRPDREYKSGEVVHGWVRASVSQNVICNGLKLTAFWESDGKGNRSRMNYFQTNLFNGRWKHGETYEYQFEFAIPDYPLTYRGENLSLEHHIGVRAEVPWPVDAFCFQDFTVRPGIPITSFSDRPLPMIEPRGTFSIISCALAVVLVVVGLLLSVKTSGISAILAIIGTWVFYKTFGQQLAKTRLGNPTIELDPVNVMTERETRLSVRLHPKHRVKNLTVEAEITGDEFVVTKSRREQFKLQHVIHRQNVDLPPTVDVEANQPQKINGVFTIPDTNAYTIDLPDTQVRWHVTVSVGIPFWPKIKLTQPFRLVPSGTSEENHQELLKHTVS